MMVYLECGEKVGEERNILKIELKMFNTGEECLNRIFFVDPHNQILFIVYL